MALKTNINYKPDANEIAMFFEEQKKSGFASDLYSYGVLLKIEYPALTDLEIVKSLKAWKQKCEQSNKKK